MTNSGKEGAVEEENVEYESDPDEEMLPAVRRRREASDDDDDDDGDGQEDVGGREKVKRLDQRVSDSESDGQGGVEEDVEDEKEAEEEEEEEEEEEVEEEEAEVEEKGNEVEGEGGYDEAEEKAEVEVKKPNWNDWGSDGEQTEANEKAQIDENEIEEKEKEPFAVPTTGAFYMHDDRFGESARNRRHTPGGRKLWETKDNQKWGHDKFEEMNLQQTHYGKDKKSSRGRYRGQGQNRVMKRGTGDSRLHAYDHHSNQVMKRGNGGSRSNAFEDNANQSHTSKVVKGRGPRRYKSPATINNGTWPTRYNESRKSHVATPNTSSGSVSTHNLNTQSDLASQRKHVFASSLNSASPPFYPSGSSNSGSPQINMQKRDARVGSTDRNAKSSIGIEENSSTSPSNAPLQGKPIGNPNGQDRFYEKSVSQVSTKMRNVHMQSFGSSQNDMHSRSQGRDSSVKSQHSFQSTSLRNQNNKVYPQAQQSSVRQMTMRTPVQPFLETSPNEQGLHASGDSQNSSPKTQSGNSSESEETESPRGSSKSIPASDGRGKNIVQGSGRGSFLFNGAHVFGAGSMGIAHGDHNFPAASTLFQVMQFGGQHPSGLGVPAVGMALPGYVAQPQHGYGNSEMTWLPPLAGAASALGAAYSPSPYMAVDDGYSGHPSGQTSSTGISSREMSANKASNTWKSPQRPELATDEFAQRQNKPRRYSEMNFGQ